MGLAPLANLKRALFFPLWDAVEPPLSHFDPIGPLSDAASERRLICGELMQKPGRCVMPSLFIVGDYDGVLQNTLSKRKRQKEKKKKYSAKERVDRLTTPPPEGAATRSGGQTQPAQSASTLSMRVCC